MGNIIYSVQQDNLTTDMGITPILPGNIEDASKNFAAGQAVIAGQPLALALDAASNTVLEVGTDASAVYGLAKESVNLSANVNEVNDKGGYGIFGSGKITACIFGVYEVKNFKYSTSDGTTVDFNAIATIDSSFVPGAALGANASGLIAVVADDAVSKFGTLVATNYDDAIQVKIGF